MKVQRLDPQSYPLTLEPKGDAVRMFYFWCNDGWCYIPEIKIRRKFILEKLNQFEVSQESWSGAIPMYEHYESVLVTVYSDSPQIWKEQTDYSSELFVEATESQSKNKKLHDHQVDRQ